MWPYVVLILLPILAQHMRVKGATLYIARPEEDNSRNALRLFFGMLLLLLILRHQSVGIDMKNYIRIFEYIAKSSWSKALGRSAEIGYSALNKLVSLVTEDFFWMQAAAAVLSVWCLGNAYSRYSGDGALTIVLFVVLSNFVLVFSGLRQSIAISLGFWAFEQVRRRRFLPFLAVVVLAVFFHTSAFMLIFLYPLYHVRISRKWLLWVIPAMAVVFLFNRQIFGVLAVFLSMYTKYDAHISSTGAYTMLILFSLFAVFAYLIPDEEALDADTLGMRNYLLLAVVLQMFAPLHNLAMRMNYYYMAFIPLVIPRIIRCRSTRWNQVALAARHIMVVFFAVYFFATAPEDNVLRTFPYRFFWEKP